MACTVLFDAATAQALMPWRSRPQQAAIAPTIRPADLWVKVSPRLGGQGGCPAYHAKLDVNSCQRILGRIGAIVVRAVGRRYIFGVIQLLGTVVRHLVVFHIAA
jgi:hypothetical protein